MKKAESAGKLVKKAGEVVKNVEKKGGEVVKNAESPGELVKNGGEVLKKAESATSWCRKVESAGEWLKMNSRPVRARRIDRTERAGTVHRNDTQE